MIAGNPWARLMKVCWGLIWSSFYLCVVEQRLSVQEANSTPDHLFHPPLLDG